MADRGDYAGQIARLHGRSAWTPFEESFAEVCVEGEPPAAGGSSILRIPVPPRDERRELFLSMRRLSERTEGRYGSYERMQAVLFVLQARFMEHYEDDYEGNAPFSMYYPSYQMMGYEQLRTYFAWRSRVRAGIVEETSLSYVFVYLYELLNGIGVRDAGDGLSKLAFLWDEYRGYEKKLDRYVRDWVRDYYVVGDFPDSFEEVLEGDGILKRLYRPASPESYFDYYFPHSDYKVKQSIFYTQESEGDIRGCFNHVAGELDRYLGESGAAFDDLVFYGGQGGEWRPFQRALYCAPAPEKERDRTVRLSDTEFYRCQNGRWTASRNRVLRDSGRRVVGYLLRRIEAFLRKKAGYRHKLNADRARLDAGALDGLPLDREDLLDRIDSAILEYYNLSRRISVSVDEKRLERIRENALLIQEKLLVEPVFEEEDLPSPAPVEPERTQEPVGGDDWPRFAASLSEAEKGAVRLALGGGSPREFYELARGWGVMPEVLVDGVNEKALEQVGDNVLELTDGLLVYDEYRESLERVIKVESE